MDTADDGTAIIAICMQPLCAGRYRPIDNHHDYGILL